MTGPRKTDRTVTPGLVSIIMNCYNSEKYLREAIDSALAQTYPNFEVIFYDNCSSDQSASIAQSAQARDARFKYFKSPKTVPLGAGRNAALDLAQGEFIAFLDCDDLWLPRRLEKQLPLFEDPAVGLVFSDSIYFSDAKKISFLLYDKRPYYVGDCFKELLSDYFLSLVTCTIRAQVLEGMQEWFDPSYQAIEEADFFRRIALKWRLAMVREPLAKWRMHPASITWTKNELFGRETTLMLAKYRKEIPGFEDRYRQEIQSLEFENRLSEFRYFWEKGENGKARGIIKRDLLKKKAAAFYLLSWLPKKKVDHLIAYLKGGMP